MEKEGKAEWRIGNTEDGDRMKDLIEVERKEIE